MDTRRTKPEGPLDAGRDAIAATEPLATVTVLPSASPQTVTVEVTLPPLPKPEALEEELAVRIDDVPVDATTVGFAAVRTSSIELPAGALDVSALLSRSTGPQLRVPPGLRTTGPTPRIPIPAPAPASVPRAPGSAFDALLTGPAPFGGHVPGATGEVPRLDGATGRRDGRTTAGNGSQDPVGMLAGGGPGPAAVATARAPRRDLKQATKNVARSLAGLVVDGRSARRDG